MPLYMVSPLFHTLCGTGRRREQQHQPAAAVSQQVLITVLKTLPEQHLQYVLPGQLSHFLSVDAIHPVMPPHHSMHTVSSVHRDSRVQIESGVHT